MQKTLLIFLAAATSFVAQEVFTAPMGFNKVTCLANSDTIVGVPFRVQGSQTAALATGPSVDIVDPDIATLTLTSINLTADTLTKHYVKFKDGTAYGRFYDITGNTTDTLTIKLAPGGGWVARLTR